jgi:uncharacterized Zn finger protein (UPF0148 family)
MKKTVEKNKCSGRVYSGSSVLSSGCQRNGKYFEDGCWWCASHAPSKKKERIDARSNKRQSEWELKEAKDSAYYALRQAKDDVVKAARGAVTGDDLHDLDKALTAHDKRQKQYDDSYKAWKEFTFKK